MPVHPLVYLDHSATTPTDPRVVEAMMPYFSEIYGNPSSAHSLGRKAEQAVERSREIIAGIFNCKPSEVVFTGAGSESDNLAIRGAAWSRAQSGHGRHLITTPIEHPAVSKTTRQMAELMDFSESILDVDHYGRVSVQAFEDACREDTVLASVIYANNEVGTVQSIADLASAARQRDVLFHTDAVQAAGQLDLDVHHLGVDLMSISAHKFYGPKGVGALYVREGVELTASQSGGSHEGGRRAGTLNTPLIIGMARALQIAYEEHDQHVAHYTAMRDAMIEGILSRVSDSQLTGDSTNRLPSHASFVFDNVDGNRLLMHLDMKGIAASSASACKTGNPEPSTVLLAMGYDRDLAMSSLRLSVGRQTTASDVAYAIDAIAEAVDSVRRLNRVLSTK